MKLAFTLAPILVSGAMCTPQVLAQSDSTPKLADPVRLSAGEALLGERRLFPSPVYHDIDGDGLQDIVVGDLFGKLTVALRKPGAGPAAYGAETKLLDVAGKEIDFHNW